MNGPSPCSVLTKSALTRAATNDSCTPVDIATAAISTRSAGGISTLSMTWITPLVVITSARITLASLTITPSPTEKLRSSPLTAAAVIPSVTADDSTLPETTW